MIIYLLKSSVCTALFYVLYLAAFRNTNRFQLNRVYLLAALLFSFVIPMIALPSTSIDVASIVPEDDNFVTEAITVTETAVSVTTNYSPVSYMYYCGVAISLLITLTSVFKTLKLYRSSEKTRLRGKTVAINPAIQPFSFMGLLFIRSREEDPIIVEHEMVHITQRHWIDLLLVELASAILWFNPVIYLFRRSIAIQHEYIADRAATSNTTIEAYLDCIARQLESKLHPGLVSSFNTRSIKQRIIMVTNTKKYRASRYALVLPVLAVLITAFSTHQPASTHAQNNELGLPVDATRLNKSKGVGFGKKINPATNREAFHKGVDFVLAAGNKVYAAAAGTISRATSSDTYGNHIVITHDKKLSTGYAHLEKILVAEGDQVEAGQLIGTVGSTGLSTGPHLHFEVLENGQAVDPASYLKLKID